MMQQNLQAEGTLSEAKSKLTLKRVVSIMTSDFTNGEEVGWISPPRSEGA